MGAKVTGLALAPESTQGVFSAARVAQDMESHFIDVRDAAAVATLVRASEPEVVLHLAAQPLVRLSYQEPLLTYATNVMGTAHLLEAVRQCPSVRSMVVVTSDKCYDNKEWHWGYRENDRLGGHDPYSNSKGCAELVTAAYRDSYFSLAGQTVALASARAGNVIGGGDWAQDRLIPDILRAIGTGQATPIRSPLALRPWQHVLEPLSGYLLLAEKLHGEGTAFAEAWNFGPAESDVKPVQWIVERMVQQWGDGAAWANDAAPHPHEATYLKLDASKATALLGWRARWDLATTVDSIVEWHKQQVADADMRDVSLRQIERYTAS